MNSNILLNIEKSVLSSIIYDYTLLKDITPNMLDHEDFYLPAHQHIYQIIQDLYVSDMPVDEVFIEKRLDKNKATSENIIDILSAHPTPNIFAYIKDIRENSNKRKLLHLSHKIISNINETDKTTTDILSDIEAKKEYITNRNISIIDKIKLKDCSDSEAEFYCKYWLPIPRGTITLLSAPGGTGKTWAILQMAFRFLIENPTKRVFLWLSEDRPSLVKNRAKQICNNILNVNIDKFDNLDIAYSQPFTLLTKNRSNIGLSSKFNQIKSELADYDLIVFDPLLAFYGGDENDNSQARVFMQPFMNWASKDNKAIVFLHHSSKSMNQTQFNRVRGASAFVDACRVSYEMNKIYKKDNQTLDDDQLHLREFKLSKDNYGAIRYLRDFNVVRQITPASSATKVEMPQINVDGEIG